MTTDELRKTFLLAALAVVACGVMILAIQTVKSRELFAEIDEWRSSSKHAQFLEWLRQNEEEE